MAALFKNPRAARKWIGLSALVVVGLFLWHPVGTHLRAMSVLLRFSGAPSTALGVQFAQRPFKEQAGSIETKWGKLRYRLYVPQGIRHPQGMVLAPGVHHLGIEHPGLISLAQALAGAGMEVMTPELKDLKDYRITFQSADAIGISAEDLSTRLGRPKVGVIGLSFAGGLALVAASKQEYARHIGLALAIGAHDDLARVSRFFATNTVEKTDGSTAPFQAHEYGALVMAYSHLEDFFSTPDLPVAREALRLWLWEQQDAALQAATGLGKQGRDMFDQLLHHRDQLRTKFLEEIKACSKEMEEVSPHSVLHDLRVPVYLLHGAGDTVIPPSETEWLAQDVPHNQLRAVLVSPALIHVAMEDAVSLRQKWALVHFLAQVLDSTDRLGD